LARFIGPIWGGKFQVSKITEDFGARRPMLVELPMTVEFKVVTDLKPKNWSAK